MQKLNRQQLRAKSHNLGFTLIEIIIVVAIIGIVVAFVGVKISRDADRLARLESERFQAIVNEVRDEAIIEGATYILEVDDKAFTYMFRVYGQDDGDGLDDLLAERKVEPGVEIEWDVLEVVDNENKDETDSGEVVVITPLGEITLFDIAFRGSDLEYHVFINEDYQLERKEEKASRF